MNRVMDEHLKAQKAVRDAQVVSARAALLSQGAAEFGAQCERQMDAIHAEALGDAPRPARKRVAG